jgi:hypothetical protein
MRSLLIYTLTAIGLVLPMVSCQAETAEPTAVIQEELDEAPLAPTRPPTGDQPSSSGLRARLEAQPSLSLGDPVKVQFSLLNETESNLYILNWFTPLEGLGGDIFRVTLDGQRIHYQGPMASRGDPTPEAYTLIEAGGTVSAEVDLSLAYDFSRPGDYMIEFVAPKLSHIAGSEEEMARSTDELGPVDIPSNQVVVAIGG